MEHSTENLLTVYKRLYNRFSKIGTDFSLLDMKEIPTILEEIEFCQKKIGIEALFSKNEEMDDIMTELIKYLYLDYFHAKALLTKQDLSERKDILYTARDLFKKFLSICVQYNLLHESEMDKLGYTQDKIQKPEDKRMFKIEKFKREKVLKQRIQEINRFLQMTKEDTQIDHEEELREMYILNMKLYASDSIDELEMIEEEIKMLRFREQLEETSTNQNKSSSSSTSSSQGPYFGLPEKYENRPGLSVTYTYKVGDQVMMTRENVKADVFGSNIAPPTMSLEEFGDLQKKDAEERAKSQTDAPSGPKKYKDLLASGEEDDDELLDIATMEDRKWDAWKEDNPKGWGNKMGKRF